MKNIVDKEFCMSSYMAFRYIEKDGVEFYPNLRHENFKPADQSQLTLVKTADDIDREIQKVFDSLKGEKLGICLSGGMDSSILASYMRGCDAYTFRFVGGSIEQEELQRAEQFAKHYGLNLHYVDIDWSVVERNLEPVMRAKAAPVHSIEPQLMEAALYAKRDGITRLIIGESADLIFGGMDKLLAKDWTLEEFQKRYTFTPPEEVLVNPVDMSYLFERFRDGEHIDFLSFMDNVFSIESSGSYFNAFGVVGIPYTDPYAKLKMAEPLDLERVRNGDSKYLIRDLFRKKYPNFPVPEKVPMPRPVDIYFKDWQGPKRREFRQDIEMSKLTGNQKWQLYCLEEFLNIYEPEK